MRRSRAVRHLWERRPGYKACSGPRFRPLQCLPEQNGESVEKRGKQSKLYGCIRSYILVIPKPVKYKIIKDTIKVFFLAFYPQIWFHEFFNNIAIALVQCMLIWFIKPQTVICHFSFTSTVRFISFSANTYNVCYEGGRISWVNLSDDGMWIISQSNGTATIRTRKFLTNRLLQRKQMVIYTLIIVSFI